MERYRLLAPDEPDPVLVENMEGESPIFLVCEHAGNRIPRRLGDMGVDEQGRSSHIAWDIGAFGVCQRLSRLLDAPLIAQRYSRLVVDCNRAVHMPSLTPQISETTPIPQNVAILEAERDARLAEIYWPLHWRISRELDLRQRNEKRTVFISVHSFTPVFMGVTRDMHVGLLFAREARLAPLVGSALKADGAWVVVENAPYALDYERDFTVPHHGEGRGLPSLEFEIRQDLIADQEGQASWAERLAKALDAAVTHLLAES